MFRVHGPGTFSIRAGEPLADVVLQSIADLPDYLDAQDRVDALYRDPEAWTRAVVRNVAALVPPFETTPGRHGVSAALEFAVQFLRVEEIVVMGHGLCGGCHAALHKSMDGAEPGRGGFIADWIAMLDEASAEVRADYSDIDNRDAGRAMEMAAVRVSIANLRTFPCIQEKEKRGTPASRRKEKPICCCAGIGKHLRVRNGCHNNAGHNGHVQIGIGIARDQPGHRQLVALERPPHQLPLGGDGQSLGRCPFDGKRFIGQLIIRIECTFAFGFL